jgi:hypothetical protein
VIGTFHSHPVGTASPGPSDIARALDDSLMFIFDCTDGEGQLWHIRRGRAREVAFEFLPCGRTAPKHALQRTAGVSLSSGALRHSPNARLQH